MKPRFEPDAVLIDPEAYDHSEQIAASLEAGRQARLVIDNREPLSAARENVESFSGATVQSVDSDSPESNSPEETDTPSESGNAPTPAADPRAWRREVAARVNQYRARRRPQAPRYPSLMLKFEPPEFISDPVPEPPIAEVPPSTETLYAAPISVAPVEDEENVAAPETAKIIEFPRPWSPPPPSPDELAEAISDRPRILEVPEVLPPPPVLGGMLIEPAEAAEAEKRPGFEIPLKSPPMSQRLLAAGTDVLLVFGAFAVFGWSFLRVTGFTPAPPQAAKTSLLLSAFFWAAYQYLMLVYTGSTPGLKLAKLRISRFDGVPATRSLRRWRVLASVLSGLSLGLGYAWCFLDEDGLCWHDRITHTYMALTEDKNANSAG